MKKHAGIDVQAMYPAGAEPKADNWTIDTFLKAAEACHKGGVPFGIGLGETTDNVDTAGAIFLSFGAQLVDAKGNLTVKTDAVRQALEFYKKLIGFLPPDVAAWDDASNNKWLVSGRGAMIMNPPSAWAVAKRDAPQVAEQCWTHGFPAGPKGRFAPFLPYFWSIWNFSKNKEAAKSLLVHLSKPASIEKMVTASGGYDLPAFEKLTTFKIWAGRRPAEGHALPLPEPVQAPDAVDRCLAGAAQDRPADLHPGHADQDVPALLPGRGDGEDPGLGRRRVRRLHAELRTRRIAAAVAQRAAAAATVLTHAHESRRHAGSAGVLGTRIVEIIARGRCIMADVALQPNSVGAAQPARKRSSLQKALKRKSTMAFLMTLPLILLIALLVLYPAFYSVHLATLNKSMQRFVGLGNFEFLFKRDTFWLVVKQSCIFAITAVDLQGADRLHRRALRPQHSGQGPAQMARHAAGAVGDSAGHEHAGLAVAVRSRPTAPSTTRCRFSASDRSRGPATPAGRASRSFWSTSGSARRSS